MYQIIVDYTPDDADKKIIRDGIITFNINVIGETPNSFSVYIKDETSHILGGILAWIHSESIYIDVIWIEESLRKKRYGTQLLRAAEEEAVKQGCKYATLDTYSFQAEEFYLKNGYERLGEINNYLFEYSKIFLRKKLYVCKL